MTTSNELFERLERAFGRGGEWLVAECLVAFLINYPATTYINLQLVRQLVPQGELEGADYVILRVLQFLAGDGIALLDTNFEIVDAEDHPHSLEKKEVRDALEHSVNPLTGEIDREVAAKIIMYFSPRAGAINDLGEDCGKL